MKHRVLVFMPPQKETDNQQPPPTEIGKEESIPRLRTFQGDMATMLEDNKVSMTTVLQAEEKRRRDRGEVAGTGEEILKGEAVKKRKKIILIGGSVLFLVGTIAIVIALYLQSGRGRELIVPGNAVSTASLIASDSVHTITLSPETHDAFLKMSLARRRAATLALGKVEELKFSDQAGNLFDAPDFFAVAAPNVPTPFVRLLEPTYFFGLVQTGYRDTFLIAETRSFNAAWSGLLDWEPSMLSDLAQSVVRLDSPAFKAVNKEGPPVTTAFEDELYENRDVRVLHDLSGNVALMYSLIDRSTIIIASSQLAFKEALDRLKARGSIR